MVLRAGVDVGGTFTDVVVIDTETGALDSTKVPTDYDDPLSTISKGLSRLTGQRQVASLHHATTLATNAVIENQLPKGLLFTTEGFGDVLDIGRIQRPEAGIFDFNIDNPEPLIGRECRIQVKERIDAKGKVVKELDQLDLREKLADFKKNHKNFSTAAVCGLFSFVNPDHEKKIGEIIAEEWPELYVSLSSLVSPEIREFERTSTVVLDALLKPILAPYLLRFDQGMASEQVKKCQIMMASGGLTTCSEAASKPVTMINSGPSAGVIAAANLGRVMGLGSFVTIDMGGTSLDIGLIENGQAAMKFEGDIAGYPVRMPTIDVNAIAAGGGSLALVDEIGMIQVDRESAGSNPGPACYGRGGSRPTITDADLILGRLPTVLDVDTGMVLQPDLANKAFRLKICEPLNVALEDAAASVLEIIQARMVKAIASNTVQKGIDTRNIPLFAYGGAGPVHSVELAEALGIRRVIIPRLAGNFSALGLLLCPVRWDTSKMILRLTDAISAEDIAQEIMHLEGKLRENRQLDGNNPMQTNWHVHMRYHGQSYDLIVDLQQPWLGSLPPNIILQLEEEFHRCHEKRYAYRSFDEEVEIVQLRVSLTGPETKFPRPKTLTDLNPQPSGTRKVFFTSTRKRLTAELWEREMLMPGTEVVGPAVIGDRGSSIIIPKGWTGSVDQWLNVDIRKN